MREDMLTRALLVVRVMERHRVRPSKMELARILGVSPRTAARWLGACYAAQIPMPPTLKDVEAA